MVARDGIEGELQVGWGAAKGYGNTTMQFHITHSSLGQIQLNTWDEAIELCDATFGKGMLEAWLTLLHNHIAELAVGLEKEEAPNSAALNSQMAN